LLLSVISLVLLSLSGCFDAGFYEQQTDENGDAYPESDVEHYYKGMFDSFEDIVLFDKEGDDKEYDYYKSFLNKSTVNKLKWENEDDEIKENAYIYMIITPKKDLKIENITFYIKGGSEINDKATLRLYLFLLKDDLDDVCKFNDDPFEKDNEGRYKLDVNNNLIIDDDYDDPLDGESLLTREKTLLKNCWDSISFSGFNGGFLTVKSGEHIAIRFENNSGIGNKLHSYSQVPIVVTNLIIRNLE